LFLYFLRLGTLGFGGPIALAGRMQQDLVESRGWFSKDEYLDGLAFAQLAPGPLAAQLAMYLGFLRCGFAGATAVAFAFVAPSFFMVLAISALYVRFASVPWLQAAFWGVGPVVIAIIARSAAKLTGVVLKSDRLLWAIATVLALATAWTQREIAWLFLAAGVAAMLIRAWPRQMAQPGSPLFGNLLLPLFSSKTGSLLIFFAKAGLFVFGSGLAIVPFLHGSVVVDRHWLNEQQFLDSVAVAMITPGPVVITVAFIGYLVAGLGGAAAAAVGVFLPVYLIVIIVGPVYRRIARNSQVHAFVAGVTAAATGAIAGAAFVLGRNSLHSAAGIVIAAASFALLLRWKVPEPLLIAAGAAVGLARLL
jgi:chromate transporter